MPALVEEMAGQRANAPGPDTGNEVPMPDLAYFVPLMARDGALVGLSQVDGEDFGWASQVRWSLSDGYAKRGQRIGSKSRTIALHRAILGLEFGDKRQADHINRDRLDNRRSNLRIVTIAQNNQNTAARGGSCRYRGVMRHRNSWRAQVRLHGKLHNLGSFKTPEEADEVARAFRRTHMPFSEEAE